MKETFGDLEVDVEFRARLSTMDSQGRRHSVLVPIDAPETWYESVCWFQGEYPKWIGAHTEQRIKELREAVSRLPTSPITFMEQQGPLKAPGSRGDDAAMANHEGAPPFLKTTREQFVEQYLQRLREQVGDIKNITLWSRVAETYANQMIDLQTKVRALMLDYDWGEP